MKFHAICNRDVNHVRSPFRIVEQASGREVDWINRSSRKHAILPYPENRQRLAG